MPRPIEARYEAILRKRLHKFLLANGKSAQIFSVLAEWHRNNWGPYLFGGFLRDLLVFGTTRYPRDIDVVLTNATSEELEKCLRPFVTRQTRFGGFQLEVSRWHFDVWPLQKTWAFMEKNLPATARNLPKTTFLNVEAVAAAITNEGLISHVFEDGFFQGIHTKTLDINLEDNPYPALAAVRALATAKKLRFSMTCRLASYIVNTEHRLGTGALVAAQDSHYGFVRFRESEIQALVAYLRYELSRHSAAVSLPGVSIRQLSLWQ